MEHIAGVHEDPQHLHPRSSHLTPRRRRGRPSCSTALGYRWRPLHFRLPSAHTDRTARGSSAATEPSKLQHNLQHPNRSRHHRAFQYRLLLGPCRASAAIRRSTPFCIFSSFNINKPRVRPAPTRPCFPGGLRHSEGLTWSRLRLAPLSTNQHVQDLDVGFRAGLAAAGKRTRDEKTSTTGRPSATQGERGRARRTWRPGVGTAAG